MIDYVRQEKENYVTSFKIRIHATSLQGNMYEEENE